MVSAAPSASELNAWSANDKYLAAVTYTSVVSVIKYCDKTSHFTLNCSNGTLTANSGDINRQWRNNGSRNRPKLSLTMICPCDIYGKYIYIASTVRHFSFPQRP